MSDDMNTYMQRLEQRETELINRYNDEDDLTTEQAAEILCEIASLQVAMVSERHKGKVTT